MMNKINIIEHSKRLSNSSIWQLQRDFYIQKGPDSWLMEYIPSYITCNAYSAEVYANIIFSYFRDYNSLSSRQDLPQTIFIVELATGLGNFTFSLLKKLTELITSAPFPIPPFKYVMTDFSEKNVIYWETHPSFAQFFDLGILECAIFDIDKDDSLHLRKSNKVYRPGKQQIPMIVLANYAFDSIPQDTFLVKDSKIFEGLITLSTNENSIEQVACMDDISYSYENKEIHNISYYKDVELNHILQFYKDTLKNSAFTIPTVAIDCIRRLHKISGSDFAFLVSDKGYNKIDNFDQLPHPTLVKHSDCISMTVNFHALELFFKEIGGEAIHNPNAYKSLNSSLFLVGFQNRALNETKFAFNEWMNRMSLDGFCMLKQVITPMIEKFDLYQILAYIRLSGFDSKIFTDAFSFLMSSMEKETELPINDFIVTAKSVWKYYLPTDTNYNTPLYVGILFCIAGQFSDALECFYFLLEKFPKSADIYYKNALCHYNINQHDKAAFYIKKSLEIDPCYEESLILKDLITNITT